METRDFSHSNHFSRHQWGVFLNSSECLFMKLWEQSYLIYFLSTFLHDLGEKDLTVSVEELTILPNFIVATKKKCTHLSKKDSSRLKGEKIYLKKLNSALGSKLKITFLKMVQLKSASFGWNPILSTKGFNLISSQSLQGPADYLWPFWLPLHSSIIILIFPHNVRYIF